MAARCSVALQLPGISTLERADADPLSQLPPRAECVGHAARRKKIDHRRDRGDAATTQAIYEAVTFAKERTFRGSWSSRKRLGISSPTLKAIPSR